jgi:hypothetical protein
VACLIDCKHLIEVFSIFMFIDRLHMQGSLAKWECIAMTE